MPSLVLRPDVSSALPCHQHSKSTFTATKWLQTDTLASKTSQGISLSRVLAVLQDHDTGALGMDMHRC